MGRVTGHKQTTDGNDYTTAYTYNLSGAVLEETYPSGRVVKNTLDADGDLQQVQSKKANDTFRNYANAFTYTAAGAVSAVRFGNGRWENTQFNNRLQPTQIGLGTSATNQSLLKLNYDYGTTDNNGNVKSQEITVQRSNQSPLVFSQTYSYDSLNRLKQAVEMTGTTQNWKQTYIFDRYGNRQFDVSNNNTTTLPQNFNPNIYNPTIDTANNRFTTGQGYTYDLSGNLLTDAEGRTFTYDAENKQKTSANTSGTIGQYFYDGDGKRVKKITNTETVIFVYDAGGKLVAEYSTQLSQTPQTQYLTNDHLGTPRINTNELGAVVSRSDYLPYGEEIVGLGNRTSADKYVSDDVRQGFTGYIKDDETGLDFAQARMYKKELGRFTSPDIVAGKTQNPQSLNRYIYVWNNPLIFIDPTGMEVSWEDSKAKQKKGEDKPRTDAQRKYENRLEEMVNSKDEKVREKGLKLQAEYKRLQDSDIVFHVVNEVADVSSGELSYKGQKGHLYVNVKGDSSAFGSLTLVQKIAHEFKHGIQFLDGEIGFFKTKNGKWMAFANDLHDESEAMMTGFDAEPISDFQKVKDRSKSWSFMQELDSALPKGEMVKF